MGEARKTRGRLEALKLRWTHCIYCGGATLGDQVEHLPPIIMFNRRRRPQGLEFLACAACNQGSRGDDQFMSLIARIAGVDRARHPVDLEETKKLRAEVSSNFPGLIQEMHWNTPAGMALRIRQGLFPDPRYERHRRADGPLVGATMRRFVSKVGLALHAHSTGRILPMGGVVCAWPVFNLREQRTPAFMFDGMAPPATLRQGSFCVADQFFYRQQVYFGGGASIHYAQFRDGFGMWAYCADGLSRFGAAPPGEHRLLRPGFLKDPSPASASGQASRRASDRMRSSGWA